MFARFANDASAGLVRTSCPEFLVLVEAFQEFGFLPGTSFLHHFTTPLHIYAYKNVSSSFSPFMLSP
jgi:hypothetical protein